MSKVSFNEGATLTIRVTFLVQTALQPMTALMEKSVLAGGYFFYERAVRILLLRETWSVFICKKILLGMACAIPMRCGAFKPRLCGFECWAFQFLF